MAAPLLIGAHIVALTTFDVETYSNDEVIRVSQDIHGVQGVRVSGGGLAGASGNCGGGPTATGNATTNVWARPVKGGKVAVILVNTGKSEATVSCDAACFAGFPTRLDVDQATANATTCWAVRDLWERTDDGLVASGHLARSVPGAGASVLLLLTPHDVGATPCPSPAVPPSPPALPGPKPLRPNAGYV